jgi:diguanylate cyclase (GGDEF)-like protein
MLGCEERELGNTPEEWFGRVHPEDLEPLQQGIRAHTTGDPARFESRHRVLHRDGTYRWMYCRSIVLRDEGGRAVRITGSHRDVTEERVSDPLTGLPNRQLFLDRLARSIERAKRHEGFLFAVLLLNLDRFRPLLHRLGPAQGELVLIAAARRFETCLRERDSAAGSAADHIIARLDGDEFAVLLEGVAHFGQATVSARRLLAALSAPLDIDNQQLFLTASIGIALSATGYIGPEEALRDADIAMHRAKSLGKARCEVFDTAILDASQARQQLETDLADALERRQFALVYQPVIAMDSSQIVGFEALVRWHHPSRTVSPNEFIPIAEKTGMILRLGLWILEEACRQLAAWQRDPGRPGTWMSVNVSGAQLQQPGFADEVREVLHNNNLDPQYLVLELTENILLEKPAAVRSTLMPLRVLGIRIALDDFGSGYSSLSYLSEFPVDILKIDRSFISRMETSADVAAIVQSVCLLAQRLGLQVVAEGIETADQLQLMRSMRCPYGQGHFFSVPVDPAGAVALLTSVAPPPVEGVALARPAVPVHPIPSMPVIETTRPARGRTTWLLAGAAAALFLGLAALAERYVRQPQPAVSTSSEATLESIPVLDEGPPWIAAEETPGAAPDRGREAGPAAAGPGETTAPEPRTRKVEAKPPPVGNQSLSRGSQVSTAPAPVEHAVEVSPPPLPKPDPQRIAPDNYVSLPAEPATSSFEVIHDHVIGNCRGVLRLTVNTIAYIPEKGKDGFEYGYDRCTCALISDNLVVKSGEKTYRFKSATSANPEDNQGRLRDIIAIVSRLSSHIPSRLGAAR